MELLKQNEGYHSSLRLQVAAVSADECGAIPWDELQVNIENHSESHSFFHIDHKRLFILALSIIVLFLIGKIIRKTKF